MNIDDAQRFVQKMRDDTGFRRSVSGFSASSEFWGFLMRSGFEFDTCDLVKAMAACMAELENTPESR
jgi:predicted ribosomally synthesized peptide with nif11-like leader